MERFWRNFIILVIISLCAAGIVMILLFSAQIEPERVVNLEGLKREELRYEQQCSPYKCISKWFPLVRNHSTSPANVTIACQTKRYRSIMKNALKGKVSWDVASSKLAMYTAKYCNGICKIKGWGTYVVNLYLKKYYTLIDPNRYQSMYQTAENVFTFFIFPPLIILISSILNCMNLGVMGIILKKKEVGGALYFHRAEILSDLVFNVLSSVHRVQLLRQILQWIYLCFPYISPEMVIASVQEYVLLFNQMMVLELVNDRLDAFNIPHQYHIRKHKSYSTNIIRKRLALIIFVGFWHHSVTSFKGFYSFNVEYFFKVLLDICIFSYVPKQAYLSFKVMKALKNVNMKSARWANQTETERNENERKKAALLWGTVGLNIVSITLTSVIRGLNYIVSRFLYTNRILIPLYFYLHWYISPSLILINGSGSFFLHVVTCKEYRAAARKTWWGKLLFKSGQEVEAKVFAKRDASGIESHKSRQQEVDGDVVLQEL